MFLELIAVIFAGLAGAGLAMLLIRVAPLPRWIVPIAAGAAMLAATISSEYGWFGRTSANLPDGLTVAQSVQSSAWYRPWTFLAPMTDRFVAVDTDRLQANEATENLYLANLYFYGRWRPITQVQIMVDCATGRRADPGRGDGSAPVWRDVDEGDAIVQTVCEAA